MPKYSNTKREDARRLFLTGEASSIAEIGRRLKTKPHTIGVWRKEEDWDGLRLKIDRRAAEHLVEQLANERVTLNGQHFKLWAAVVSRLLESLKGDCPNAQDARTLEKIAGVLDRAQKGQRLARGLSLDGQTEEQIRAEAAAESRRLIDLFVDVVKSEVKDEAVRDRIARILLERLPRTDDDEAAAEQAVS